MRKWGILAIVLLFLLLSACSSDDEAEALQEPLDEITRENPVPEEIDYVYQARLFDLPDDFLGVSQFTVMEGQIFAATMRYDTQEALLVSVDLYGEPQMRTEISLPNPRGFLIGPRRSASGEVFLLAQTYREITEGIRVEYQATLLRLDLAGNLLDTVILEDLDGMALIFDMQIDGSGVIHLLRDGRASAEVLLYHKDGTRQGSFSLDRWGHVLLSVGDTIYVSDLGGWGEAVYAIDPVAMEVSARIERHRHSLPHSSGNERLFYSVFSHPYSQDLTSGISQEELRFPSVGIGPDEHRWIEVTRAGEVVVLLEGGRIAVLTRVLPDEIPSVREVTLATARPDMDLEVAIARFNMEQEQYQIVLRDYSVYNTYEDWTLGHRRLREDILGGESFDLLDVTGLPLELLAARGLLRDLYTLIDGACAIAREEIHPSVREVLEIGGALYALPDSFYLVTLGGGDVGHLAGWNMAEFLAYAESLPGGVSDLLQDVNLISLLQIITALNWSELVDFTRGAAHFDADFFVSFLEYTGTFELADFDSERRAHYQVLQFTEFQVMPLYNAIFDGIQFAGFPSELGHVHGMGFWRSLAISAESEVPEIGWAFMRQQLSRDDGWARHFPILLRDLEAELEAAIQSEEVETWGFGAHLIEVGAISSEEAQMVLDLIMDAHTSLNIDEVIWGIIAEEAERFYGSEQSAEAAARAMNRRVQELLG